MDLPRKIIPDTKAEYGESAQSPADSEGFRDAILSTIYDVVFSIDMKGRFTYLSPSFQKITGIECSSMIGRRFSDFLESAEADLAMRHFEAMKAEPSRPITFSYRLDIPSREPSLLEIIIQKIEPPEMYNGFAGVARNIEHRYATATLIGNAGEEYKSFLYNIEDGYYEVDLSGTFVACNPYFTRLLGYGPGELIGMKYADVVDEETANVLYEQFNEFFTTGGARGMISGTYITRTGEERIAEGTVTMRRNRAGRVVGFCGLIRDITERMNLESALKASESQWRRLYNSLPGGAFLVDSDRVILDVNRITCELTGYRYDQLVGHSCETICPHFAEKCVLTAGGGHAEFDNIEADLVRADGSTMRIIKSADVIESPDSLLVLENFHDVTQLKKIESALRASEETLRKKNETMEKDLHAAQLIQRNLIGAALPATRDIRCSFRYIPLTDVGGDFFSIRPLSEGGTGIFVGDVASHGVSAALFLALIKATTDRVCRDHALAPMEYITRLNAELYGNMPLSFMTAIYGVFRRDDPERCEFAFSSAGHPWPVLYRAATGKAEFVNSKGTLLGIFLDLEFEETRLTLNPGDRVYLYTDGIPETYNESNEIWGFERMCDLIESTHMESIEESLDRIVKTLTNFRGNASIADDVIILAFEA